MNKQRVLQALENVKSNPYGKWGILNIEQRSFIKELCDSWLILYDATNKQMEEIEKLNNIINKAIEYIEQPDNIQSVAFCKEDGEIMNLYKIDGAKSLELLDILKGSDKE